MEKLLWNAAGIVLVLANIIFMMFFLFSNPWLFALLVSLILDWIYIEKRPTWLEF